MNFWVESFARGTDRQIQGMVGLETEKSCASTYFVPGHVEKMPLEGSQHFGARGARCEGVFEVVLERTVGHQRQHLLSQRLLL